MKDWGGRDARPGPPGTSVSLGKLSLFKEEDRLVLEGFSFPQTSPQ